MIDAVNLERNLYLTLQLLELGIPCIVALNMLDIAESQHIEIDINTLSKNWVARSFHWYRPVGVVSMN